MKKIFAICTAAFLICCVSGCDFIPDSNQDIVAITTEPEPTGDAVITQILEPVPEPESEPPVLTIEQPEQTLPEHSQFYINGLSVEDVILFFNEVCLDAEFVSDGDPTRLQKWTVPIYYKVFQEPTQEDIQALNEFTAWLNTIEGFPGIYETDDPTVANMNIHFCSQQQMMEILGDNFVSMDGGVTFWYLDDQIYNAVICYRTDIDQNVRNSVILEEIYNGLGPVQDTSIRLDSIIYTGYSQPQSLTEIDELILKLLYHPDMQCGMNSEACQRVIRSLYY